MQNYSLYDLIKYQEFVNSIRKDSDDLCDQCSSKAVIFEESIDDEEGDNIGENYAFCLEHADYWKAKAFIEKALSNQTESKTI